MHRQPTTVLGALSIALLGSAAVAAPPNQPGALRADVYSNTAAELFWTRSSDPDGGAANYEVRRDGRLVSTRDGSSYFTQSLVNGRTYAFTVTAVDADGERSAPASVRIVAGNRGGAVSTGGSDAPAAPANLRSAIYSSTAAEVFWDRVTTERLSYEVAVDGRVVATTDGISRFLSGLVSTRGVAVTVVAIDADGRRSEAAGVTLGDGSTPPVTGAGDAPAAPDGLRGERYSFRAGEVFWNRVSGARLSYEVSVGGELVASTDGTSEFIDNRSDLDTAVVEVVAIDQNGLRSSVASTSLARGVTVTDPDTTDTGDTGDTTDPSADGSPAGDFAVVTNAAGGTGGVVFYSPDLATPDAARQMIQAGANQGIAFAPDGTLYQNSDAAGAEGLYRIGEDGSAVSLAPFPGKGLSYIDSDRDYLASCDVTAGSADLRLFDVVEDSELPLASIGVDLVAPCWDTLWDKPNDRLYITLTDGGLAVMDDFSADIGATFTVDRTIIPASEILEPASTNLHGVAARGSGDVQQILVSDVGDPASATDGRIFILIDDGLRDGPTIATQYSIYGPDTMLGNPVDILVVDDTLVVAEKSNDLLLTFDLSAVRDGEGNVTPTYMAPFDKPESIELVVGR